LNQPWWLRPFRSRRRLRSPRRQSGKNRSWPKRRHHRRLTYRRRRLPRRRAQRLHHCRGRPGRPQRAVSCRRRFVCASRIRAPDRRRLLHRVVRCSCGPPCRRPHQRHRHRPGISAGQLLLNRDQPLRQDPLARGQVAAFRPGRERQSAARDRCRHSRFVPRLRHGQVRRPTGRPCTIGPARSDLARDETSCRGRQRLRPRRWRHRRSPGPLRWRKA
jgi:hypothetical protein